MATLTREQRITAAGLGKPNGVTSTELPSVALVKRLLYPMVIVVMLAACTLAYGESFSEHYMALAVVAFFFALQFCHNVELSWAGQTFHGQEFHISAPGRRILWQWIKVVGVLLFLGFVTKLSGVYSRKVILTWFAVTPFAMLAAPALARALLHRMIAPRAFTRSAVIIGANDLGGELARRVREAPYFLGVDVKGFFDDRDAARLSGIDPSELLGRLEDAPEYVGRHAVNLVYISLPMVSQPRIIALIEALRDTTASVYFVPNIFGFDPIQARLDELNGIPVIAIRETPFCGIDLILKNASDFMLAGVILLLIWPALLSVAIGVKLSSPGPVLFKQRRYGLDGEPIVIYKFRTMTVCEDGDEVIQAKKNDQRVTRFGAFLRKTSLDELPQFINVLEGKMSIVGPRPHAVAQNEQYRKLISDYMFRHKVRPGITGWAQVNGFRGETDTLEKMKARVEYDLDYLRNWSLALDLWIICKTVLLMLHDRNAY